MKIHRFFIIFTFIIISLTNTQAIDNKARHVDLIQEGEYPFWPKFNPIPLKDIRPQQWRTKDDIIDGWDWSLPLHVKPSARSLIGVQRYMGYKVPIEKVETHFPVNPATLHWVPWKQIEPEDGIYKWDELKKRILQAKEGGTVSILRMLTCCLARTEKGEEAGHTPSWLKKYKIKKLTYENHRTIRHRVTVNYDPSDPIFHKHYLRLIRAFKTSGIPQMKELQAAYVGYASPTLGDEGIGPKGVEDPPHVKERLDAWIDAFKGVEYKVFMGNPSPYGLSHGFGIRRGFVEMYLYHIPDEKIGQHIDPDGFLFVDENAPVIKLNCFQGEVNEEYDATWATEHKQFRFGKTTKPFSYRYLMSNLRLLQMRCTYVHNKVTLIPELLPFVSLELGRSVNDTPDIWCALRESYMNAKVYKRKDTKNRIISDDEMNNGLPIKNFERWLYQREMKGYPTSPAVRVQHAYRQSMVFPDKAYDYIARAGKMIGFAVDDRFLLNGPHDVAVKITYFDISKGKLSMLYSTKSEKKEKSIPLNNTKKLKTATFFLNRAYFNAKDKTFDLVIKGEPEAVVSFLRVIKL